MPLDSLKPRLEELKARAKQRRGDGAAVLSEWTVVDEPSPAAEADGGGGATAEATRETHRRRWDEIRLLRVEADRLAGEARKARVSAILAMRADGMLWSEIVEVTGLTRARLNQIVGG